MDNITSQLNKYLIFITDGRKFSVAFEDIKSIIVADKLTPIPEFPYYFAGTCTVENKTVPVIDSRKRFGFEPCGLTDRSCIIVCFYHNGEKKSEIGIVADTISVMKEIPPQDIQPCAAVSSEAYTRYLKGVFIDEGEPCYIVSVSLMVNDCDKLAVESIQN